MRAEVAKTRLATLAARMRGGAGPEGAGLIGPSGQKGGAWSGRAGLVTWGGATHATGPSPPASPVCGLRFSWKVSVLQAGTDQLSGLLSVEQVLQELKCPARTLLTNVPSLRLHRISRIPVHR